MASKLLRSCPECHMTMPLRISWSGLRTHEECKQKSYLMRTGKKATLADQRVFFAGNVTDRVVRNWLLNDPESHVGEMPDMVSAMIDTHLQSIKDEGGVMRWKDSGDRERVEKDCIEAVTAIEPHLRKYVTPFRSTPDYKFSVPLEVPHPKGGTGEILLIGFMDILVQDDKGRFWIWDVKHTKDSSYWRKTIAQIGFYDLAVELQYGQPMVAGGLLQPLVTKQPIVPYKPSEQSRAELIQRIAGMARDIWMDDKTPKKGTAGCGFCDVKHACEKFKPTVQGTGPRRITLRRS